MTDENTEKIDLKLEWSKENGTLIMTVSIGDISLPMEMDCEMASSLGKALLAAVDELRQENQNPPHSGI